MTSLQHVRAIRTFAQSCVWEDSGTLWQQHRSPVLERGCLQHTLATKHAPKQATKHATTSIDIMQHGAAALRGGCQYNTCLQTFSLPGCTLHGQSARQKHSTPSQAAPRTPHPAFAPLCQAIMAPSSNLGRGREREPRRYYHHAYTARIYGSSALQRLRGLSFKHPVLQLASGPRVLTILHSAFSSPRVLVFHSAHVLLDAGSPWLSVDECISVPATFTGVTRLK